MLAARRRTARVIRHGLARLRGERDVEQLVAEGLQLGPRVFIARGVRMHPPSLISVGEGSGLSPGVIVLGRAVIGRHVFVGARATILPGSVVGDDAIVAAGAVVSGEVPAGAVVAGNPAKVVTTVEAFADWHRDAIARAPVWPHEGWMAGRGITPERREEQRRALADGRAGYLAGAGQPTAARGA
jgi:carbonic anhydrase/acetyltransferase-like protein (isoleucine patch superfamily)